MDGSVVMEISACYTSWGCGQVQLTARFVRLAGLLLMKGLSSSALTPITGKGHQSEATRPNALWAPSLGTLLRF